MPRRWRGFGLFRAEPLTIEEKVSLQSVLGHGTNVLVTARGPQALVVVLPEVLAVRRGGAWRLIAWETIQWGGWRQKGDALYWQLIDNTSDEVQLDRPADLPFVFAERVRASIVANREVLLDDDLGRIHLAGRRPPTQPDAPITWTVQAVGRTDLSDARVQELIVKHTRELRAEFE